MKITVIAIFALLMGCAAAVQEPVTPVAEQNQFTDIQLESVEITVYDRGDLDTLEETLAWAGYSLAPGYPKKLRFGQGWLVLAHRQ